MTTHLGYRVATDSLCMERASEKLRSTRHTDVTLTNAGIRHDGIAIPHSVMYTVKVERWIQGGGTHRILFHLAR